MGNGEMRTARMVKLLYPPPHICVTCVTIVETG